MCEALDESKSKKSKTFFAQKKKKLFLLSFIPTQNQTQLIEKSKFFYTHLKQDSLNKINLVMFVFKKSIYNFLIL